MYTRIHITRDDASQTSSTVYQELLAACQDAVTRGAQASSYGNMSVGFSAYGISCQLNERVLRMPELLHSLPVTHVTIEVPYWVDGKLDNGTYSRRRATAVVTQTRYLHIDGKKDTWKITVQASTLGAGNRLLDDIITGKAKPTVSYVEGATN